MGFQGTTCPPRPRRCRRRGRPSSALALLFGLLTRRVRSRTDASDWCGTRSHLERLRQPLPVDARGYQTRPRYPGGGRWAVALTHGVNFGRTVWKRLLQVLGQRQTLGHRGQVVSESKLVTVLNDAFWRQKGHAYSSGGTPGSLVQVVHPYGYHGAHRAFVSRQRVLKGIRGGDYFDMLWVPGLSMQSGQAYAFVIQEIITRFVKYALEGLVVALAAFTIPQRQADHPRDRCHRTGRNVHVLHPGLLRALHGQRCAYGRWAGHRGQPGQLAATRRHVSERDEQLSCLLNFNTRG
jgi:hypothetical protein